jgi:hypothetical protein
VYPICFRRAGIPGVPGEYGCPHLAGFRIRCFNQDMFATFSGGYSPQYPKYHTAGACGRRTVPGPVMHTSRVSSPRYSASRVFFCPETASLYSSPTRLTRLLPQLIFHCATVFYAPRRHSRLPARQPHSPTTLDSPRARLAASCASLMWAS